MQIFLLHLQDDEPPLYFSSCPKTPHQSKNPRAFPFLSHITKMSLVAVLLHLSPGRWLWRLGTHWCFAPSHSWEHRSWGDTSPSREALRIYKMKKSRFMTTLHWQLERGEFKVPTGKLPIMAIHATIWPSEHALKENKLDKTHDNKWHTAAYTRLPKGLHVPATNSCPPSEQDSDICSVLHLLCCYMKVRSFLEAHELHNLTTFGLPSALEILSQQSVFTLPTVSSLVEEINMSFQKYQIKQ